MRKPINRQQNSKAKLKAYLRAKTKKIKKTIKSPVFHKKYAIFSVLVLASTSLLWALLGASLHRGNADQLINSYLFDSSSTFSQATFPSAHSFLIKWPVFFLVHLFGVSGFSLALFTSLSVLATVGALAYVIYRIERRPIYFGTICLALASVLLLVPAQPYAGGLLPVNMAMLATRNLEYVLYIASLIILIKAPRVKSYSFGLATIFLALLIASDKLFLTLTVAGGLLALLGYGLARKSDLVKLSAKWLLCSFIAALAALAILWLLGNTSITNISSQSGSSPYGLVQGVQNLTLGALYAFLGVLTNFGANPAFDATVVRNIPSQIEARLLDFGGISFLINAAIFGVGVFMSLRLILSSLKSSRLKKRQIDQPTQLALLLLWTSLAALAAFVLSNHYYAVDARYLTIALFAVFISAATYVRKVRLSPNTLILSGVIIGIGILLGIVGLMRTYDIDKAALADVNRRNSLVAQALSHHPVNILVGDYWRVIPTKLATKNQINVLPLATCTTPRDSLTTLAWQPDLKTTSFAYLLSLDKSLTDYPQCELDQVVAAYGQPNTSALVAGSLDEPKELLLFYDRGAFNSAPQSIEPQQSPTAVLPISLNKLSNVHCAAPTILNVVAHQDDDLLFMSPDLMNEIKDGNCVRTIYVTAGDAGSDNFYWLSREQGSEAAYSKMLGSSGVWIKRIVKIADNQFIRVDSPKGNSKVSLIFVRLADGNARGQGFMAMNYESLAKLETGEISGLHTVDRQSVYNYSELVNALLAIMRTYHPTEIHTQANYVSKKFPDHSDHMAVGRLTGRAWEKYDSHVLIKFYLGYPIYEKPANVTGQDLQQKQAAFFAYSQFDSNVCHTLESCEKSKASYNAYLPRQYTNSE